MRKLYFYYLKKRLFPILIALALLLIFGFFYSQDFRVVERNWQDEFYYGGTYLTPLLVIGLIMVPILVLVEFSFKMRKNSLDLFYSLPISRRKLFLTKYLLGISEIFVLYSTIYLFFAIRFVMQTAKVDALPFDNVYLIPYYFISLGLFILLFGFLAFFYTRANNVVDGILGLVLASTVLMALVHTAQTITFAFKPATDWINNKELLASYFTEFSPSVVLSTYFTKLIQHENKKELIKVAPLVIMIVINALATFALLFFNPKLKAENAQELSRDLLTYRIFLPVIISCLLALGGDSILVDVIIIIFGYVAYIIFNRHFKLSRFDWLAFGIAVVVGLSLYFLIMKPYYDDVDNMVMTLNLFLN